MNLGIVIQVYLEKVPGSNRTAAAKIAAMTPMVRDWKRAGASGLMPHGSTLSLPRDMPLYVTLARAHGLDAYAAFGLDSDDAAGKGRRIAVAANVPGVKGVVFDCEGAWEDESAAAEAAHAEAMGKAFRKDAERALAIHQPWPVPSVHWSRYPWIQFAEYFDIAAPQDYYNDWTSIYGRDRFKILEPRFQREWAKLEAEKLIPAGQGGDQRIKTVQGYGWDDIPYECVDCFVRSESLIVWCEPYPEKTVLGAMAVRQRINEKVGLWDASGRWIGSDGVRRFQKAYNAKAPPSARLVEDNEYGPATERALFGGPVQRALDWVARYTGWSRP